MDKEELIAFNNRIIALYNDAEIHTPVHLSGGNEDQLIDIFENIRVQDWVFSTYRSHYHALLKGILEDDLVQMILDGKSMHINSKKYKFFTSSIVGGCLPIALGVAVGIKRKGMDEKVWVFVGDMAGESGIFYECVKYAEFWSLPIEFVVEDNGFSVFTPTQEAWMPDSWKWFGEAEKSRSYKYERVWPHSGTGVWVTF